MSNTWVCIFGDDQHMVDWPPGVILIVLGLAERHAVPPNAPPPAQKPKLRQQLSS